MSHLSQLALHDFRAYESTRIPLEPGVNVLVGGNGAGKTTVLEAVHFLCLLRSFRTTQTRQLIRWGCDGFSITGRIPATEAVLGVRHGKRRELRLNGAGVSRASDFVRQFFCVPFLPSDQALIRGPGAGRRRFLDVLLCQLSCQYLQQLQVYGAALRQRNALLRAGNRDTRMYEVYERQLSQAGAAICSARAEFVANFAPLVDSRADCLRIDAETELRYRTRFSESEEALYQALVDARPRDQVRGTTQIGPHRDDVLFLRDGRSLADYGSEGQCRATALALRMASTDCLLKDRTTGQPVVLLIDDVTGDLDAARQEAFLELVRGADQALVATTDPSIGSAIGASRRIEIENGAVRQ